jgi:hypothetical protein
MRIDPSRRKNKLMRRGDQLRKEDGKYEHKEENDKHEHKKQCSDLQNSQREK